MAPVKKTLSVWKGNTERFTFRLKQSDGSPVNLTGSRLVITIRADSPIIKDSATSDDWQILDADGEATVKLTAAETAAMSNAIVNTVTYEIERFITDEQKTLLYGEITLAGGLNGN